jgi:hypothetical protein
MIDHREFPEEERDYIDLIADCSRGIGSQVEFFEAAVGLADFADADHRHMPQDLEPGQPDLTLLPRAKHNMMLSKWRLIAAQHGAICIYNVHELIQSINGLLGGAPTFRDLMDKQAMSRERNLHEEAFPGFTELRFTVAHAGLAFRSPEKARNHKPAGENIFFKNSLVGRQFTTHANGKHVAYMLLPETTAILDSIFDNACAALEPVVQFTRARLFEHFQERQRQQREGQQDPQ